MIRGLAAATILAILTLLGSAPTAAGQSTGLPSTLGGLALAQEKVGKASSKSTQTQYLTQIALYSLRQPNQQLEATIQIGRFRSGSPVRSRSFQRQIAGQIGTTVPREQRVGNVTVYITKGKKLSLVAWFRGDRLMILSIREEFGSPKALIREAVRMTP